MPPFFGLGLFTKRILPAIGGMVWVRFISKRVSDKIISGKIGEIVEEVKQKIESWYLDYRWNIYITLILNFLIAGITIITHYFFTINDIVICIVSLISIFMILRTLIRIVKSILYTIIPNWNNIFHYTRIFLIDLFGGYGIIGSIRDAFHVAFVTMYYNSTNDFTRGVHTVFSKLGFVKSELEISEEVQDRFCNLIIGYTVRMIIYKIIAFIVYILVFSFLLRPFIFTYTLKLNFLQLVFYPFTVAMPIVIKFIFNSL